MKMKKPKFQSIKFKAGDLIEFDPVEMYLKNGKQVLCIFLEYVQEDSVGNLFRMYNIQDDEYDRGYDYNYILCECDQ